MTAAGCRTPGIKLVAGHSLGKAMPQDTLAKQDILAKMLRGLPSVAAAGPQWLAREAAWVPARRP
jgi:hypothetical protein